MAKKQSDDLAETASALIKNKGGFSLESFKKSKFLDQGTKFKEQKWIPQSKAFTDILSIPGIPMGHITLLRGNSDTGKTTALLETAVNAQKKGILPVFIITEMKWSWAHVIEMGFEVEEVKDEDGNVVDYKGFFIYVDRSSLNTVEDVASFIADLMDEQKKGKLPYDLCFLWDSIGSVPCKMSVEKASNNNEWNAGAMSTQFGNFINQKILLSRKENYPYTNTLVAVNKVWVAKAENPMSQPKMKNKGGETMFYDCTLMVTFGNVSNSGTSKIKATKNGKEVEFAKRTKVHVEKNHITGIQTRGSVVMTIHGFIDDDKSAIDNYKKLQSPKWESILGGGNYDIVEDDKEWEESKNLSMVEIETENE
jgi:Fe-S cluster assembly iron-binding protein IscA